eukprot:superscaffoldBa00010478_g24730
MRLIVSQIQSNRTTTTDPVTRSTGTPVCTRGPGWTHLDSSGDQVCPGREEKFLTVNRSTLSLRVSLPEVRTRFSPVPPALCPAASLRCPGRWSRCREGLSWEEDMASTVQNTDVKQ